MTQITNEAGELIDNGVYTPALTNVANVAASTAYPAMWIRVGKVVSIAGRVDIDPTLTATLTRLGLSLPIPTTFTALGDCSGAAGSTSIAEGAAVRADTTNNRAEIAWTPVSVANNAWYFTYMYKIA
jgi:hypothetical protein